MHYYDTIEQIKEANRQAGLHWFEPNTLRFFRSRVGHNVYGGRYFISSEQFSFDSERLYSIRIAYEDGRIDTIGEFQQYKTWKAAYKAVQQLLQEENVL
jgi:hypothetical protein